uniref:Glutathione synthetase n=1 Tax=Eptatretus burgeri TaxID=7764 RepID=A0A8C4PY86_EPTBU
EQNSIGLFWSHTQLIHQVLPQSIHNVLKYHAIVQGVPKRPGQHWFVVCVDDFTARLYNLYEEVRAEGISKPVVLGINRSDYMLDTEVKEEHQEGFVLRQVELNTISACLGGMASKIPYLHRYVYWEVPYIEGTIAAVNLGVKRLVWVKMCCVCSEACPIVLSFSFFLTLNTNGNEVAVVYFRTGYAPNQYDDSAWRVRRMLERSRASCCPDIATQLAGTKKVQQELASSDVLISSLGFSATTAARLQQTFTTMFSLDDGEDGDKAVQKALANPSGYVLKPQRDGGGNNLYDEDIVHFFESNERGLQRKDRAAFILMHRLRPPPEWNVPIRPNTLPRPELCVSELGVFGAYVRCGTDMIFNSCCGHLLRSKNAMCNEGGILRGDAMLDNPYLVEEPAKTNKQA